MCHLPALLLPSSAYVSPHPECEVCIPQGSVQQCLAGRRPSACCLWCWQRTSSPVEQNQEQPIKSFHLLWFFFTPSCFRKGMCMVILWCLYLAFPKNKYISLFLTEHSIFPSIQCIQRSWWLEEILGNWTDTLFPWPKLTCFKRRNELDSKAGNMWWEDLEHGPECRDGLGSSQS